MLLAYHRKKMEW